MPSIELPHVDSPNTYLQTLADGLFRGFSTRGDPELFLLKLPDHYGRRKYFRCIRARRAMPGWLLRMVSKELGEWVAPHPFAPPIIRFPLCLRNLQKCLENLKSGKKIPPLINESLVRPTPLSSSAPTGSRTLPPTLLWETPAARSRRMYPGMLLWPGKISTQSSSGSTTSRRR